MDNKLKTLPLPLIPLSGEECCLSFSCPCIYSYGRFFHNVVFSLVLLESEVFAASFTFGLVSHALVSLGAFGVINNYASVCDD